MHSTETPSITVAECAEKLQAIPNDSTARRVIERLLRQHPGALRLEHARPIHLATIFCRASKIRAHHDPRKFDLLNQLIEHLGVDALVGYFGKPERQRDIRHFAMFLNAVAKGDPKGIQGLLSHLNNAGLIDHALANPLASTKHLAFLFNAIGKADTTEALTSLRSPNAAIALRHILTEGGAQDVTMALTAYLVNQATPARDLLEPLRHARPDVYIEILRRAAEDPDGPAGQFVVNDAFGRAAYALHVKDPWEAYLVIRDLLDTAPQIEATTRPDALFKVLVNPAARELLPELFEKWTPEAIFNRLSQHSRPEAAEVVRQLHEEALAQAGHDGDAAASWAVLLNQTQPALMPITEPAAASYLDYLPPPHGSVSQAAATFSNMALYWDDHFPSHPSRATPDVGHDRAAMALATTPREPARSHVHTP